MKKILLLLFFVISTLSFSEWKVGERLSTIWKISSEGDIGILYDENEIIFIDFPLKPEEMKKLLPFYRLFKRVKVEVKIDDNDIIFMKGDKAKSNIYLVTAKTEGKNSIEDKKEIEKQTKIVEQMAEGKQLKITFIKGKDKIEKYIDLKGFKEKLKEAKKKNN